MRREGVEKPGRRQVARCLTIRLGNASGNQTGFMVAASKKCSAIEAYLEDVVRSVLPILPYDQEAATWHARERARLRKRGRPPTAADGQIAAIASVNDLIVVTANVKDYRRFKDLVVEDWSR